MGTLTFRDSRTPRFRNRDVCAGVWTETSLSIEIVDRTCPQKGKIESRIPNPESRIPNPESRIPNPESRIYFFCISFHHDSSATIWPSSSSCGYSSPLRFATFAKTGCPRSNRMRLMVSFGRALSSRSYMPAASR
ncbi:hypothetical protein Vca1114GL_01810 [Vibrio campbellii]|nr:hypothetical protein Vca1114GL_01810 [Vibrio campbellii]